MTIKEVMKAIHIKKLRREVEQYKPFTISVCYGLFGFDYKDSGCDIARIMASDIEGAIRKYFRRYERKYKEKSTKHLTYLNETTRNWGRVMVIDSRGYKTYWK